MAYGPERVNLKWGGNLKSFFKKETCLPQYVTSVNPSAVSKLLLKPFSSRYSPCFGNLGIHFLDDLFPCFIFMLLYVQVLLFHNKTRVAFFFILFPFLPPPLLFSFCFVHCLLKWKSWRIVVLEYCRVKVKLSSQYYILTPKCHQLGRSQTMNAPLRYSVWDFVLSVP